jgi:hypothetical protein
VTSGTATHVSQHWRPFYFPTLLGRNGEVVLTLNELLFSIFMFILILNNCFFVGNLMGLFLFSRKQRRFYNCGTTAVQGYRGGHNRGVQMRLHKKGAKLNSYSSVYETELMHVRYYWMFQDSDSHHDRLSPKRSDSVLGIFRGRSKFYFIFPVDPEAQRSYDTTYMYKIRLRTRPIETSCTVPGPVALLY